MPVVAVTKINRGEIFRAASIQLLTASVNPEDARTRPSLRRLQTSGPLITVQTGNTLQHRHSALTTTGATSSVLRAI